MNVLEVKDLKKSYPGFQLNVDALNLEAGRIMGFIGRNGAGKTTTLKSLLGLVSPEAGEIRFFGLPFAGNESALKQRVGFAAGGVDFYTKKKLRAITAVTSRFYDEWDGRAYEEYLRRFGLDENKTPDQLSAGMRVKYAIALALSHRAELLILDEPTSGLDPVSRDELLALLLTLAEEGKTILFSTHITSDLDKCADDITYIRRGRIAAAGTLESFTAAYRLVAPEETLPPEREALLIGRKRAKHGYTALVRAEDEEKLGLETQEADLETVMVHLEKEDDHEAAL